MNKEYKKFETMLVHDDRDSKALFGSLSLPIFETSTFIFENAEQGEKRFAGNEEGYIYSRLGNPTVMALESKIAQLEGGEAGLAFSSGMGAISATLFALTKANDHIICSKGIYGCTFGLLRMMEEKYNIKTDFCELETEEQIRAFIQPNTACIYVETPINPTMKVINLELVANVAKQFQIPVVVDNTFLSPYIQQPLKHGCDIVVHSATKYIGGHGDVIAGLVVGKKDFIQMVAKTTRKDIGSIISPFDAWLILRGLKTLSVRMDRHCSNAEKICRALQKHMNVKAVYYPGAIKHHDFSMMKKQMNQGGGVISFEIKGSRQDAQKLLNKLTFIKIAVSLGDTETLIQHPATMTHAIVPEEVRKTMGIPDQMIRLSVGLEHWKDIWNDLKQALDNM